LLIIDQRDWGFPQLWRQMWVYFSESLAFSAAMEPNAGLFLSLATGIWARISL
jgi:hypothetical protein